MLAFDFMVRIKYYKGYVEPGGDNHYMNHVNDICNDELELDGIITAFMLFPPVSQMFSYKYTL